ncbi:MAG TPA: hypothetical protein VIH90_00415 [Candidatus Saccharimonadales bacterium]
MNQSEPQQEVPAESQTTPQPDQDQEITTLTDSIDRSSEFAWLCHFNLTASFEDIVKESAFRREGKTTKEIMKYFRQNEMSEEEIWEGVRRLNKKRLRELEREERKLIESRIIE